MKTNFAILILCFILNHTVKCQMPCYTTPPASSQNSQYRFDESCLSGDAEVYNYIPNPSMPELQFRVNFIFLTHPTVPTRYSASTLQQLTADCDSGLSYINNLRLKISGQMPSFLNTPVVSPTVDTVKFKFIRNHVYEFIDTLGITKAFGTNKLFFKFPFDTANSVNIYFYEERDTSYWDGAYVQEFSGTKYISFSASPVSPIYIGQHVPGQPIGGDLLWHELGHALGNLADHYENNKPPRNTDPLNGSYSPDDSAIDSVLNYNCGISFLGRRNNNLMGNSPCRTQMSARQIAAFHYLVAKNRTKKYTQFNGLTYPYVPNIIPNAYSLNGVQTIVGNLPPFTVLTIPTGADITLSKLSLKLPANAKIIVQPGARLTMKCVAISLKTQSSPGINHWKGIEVWGIPSSPQLLNSNGTSNLQGVLNMENCDIRDAQFAILAGKRQPTGQVNNWNSGGGIIFAKNCNFIDNQIDVWMTPKPYGSGAAFGPGGNINFNSGNRSTFNYCSFVKTSPASWNYNGYDKTMVKLEGVADVKFYDNEFYGAKGFSDWDTTYCIKGYNSNVIVQSPLAPLIKNTFDSTYYGIYMAGGRKNIIEDAVFYTRNGIYVSNSNYNKIVRNMFRLDFVSNAPFDNSLRTGIYMNESSKFKIEENDLACGGLNSVFSEGMCINNSGPEANQVYNNTFFKLTQGLWCQNVNYDANSLTYDGLKLNCNDFTLCKYDIGVQNQMFPPVYNGGIAKTQGLITLFATDYVRNTYRSETDGGNQNKFYNQPGYSNPPVIIHGNYLDAFGINKFKVGPQTVYPFASNPTYVSDLSGMSAPSSNKSSYCPSISSLPASRVALNANLSAVNDQLTTQLTLFYASLDGGNTQHLLDLINNHLLSGVQLKDTLQNRDFLSDTVLCSYFTSSITPESYLSLIFNANAPVSKKVWNVVAHLELSASTMSVLNAAQSANTISPRTAKVSQMALTKAERSYTIMHKSLSLLMDSSVTHVKDSLAALIIMNDQGDVPKQLIELDLDFDDYSSAKLKINDYVLEGTAEKTAFGNYKNLYLDLLADSAGLQSLETNQSARDIIGAIAADASHPCMIEARDLLKAVLGVNYTELKLVPSESLGGRMAQASSAVNDADDAEIQSALAGAISIFPNPATQEVFIQNASIFDYQMKIFTITGQLLFEGPVKVGQLSKIETESFNDGIYFVNLYQGKLLIKTNKLIIAK